MLSDSLASEQKLYDLAQSGDLGKYRYLHLATHGTADERFPCTRPSSCRAMPYPTLANSLMPACRSLMAGSPPRKSCASGT